MERFRSFALSLVLALTWHSGTVAIGAAEPDRIPTSPAASLEAYGDSLTAGFLSYTDVTKAPPLKQVSRIMSDLAAYLVGGDKDAIAQHHRPDLAWPALLAKSLGIPKTHNAAVSGARVVALESQVTTLGKASDAIAFFFMGHNDLCNTAMTPETMAEHFSVQFTKALTAWDASHLGSTAYLMPVGDIYRALKALQGYAWYNSPKQRYACEDSWEKFFPYCPSHARRLKEGTLEEYLKPRRDAINRAIAAVAATFAKQSSRNRFFYPEAAFDYTFEPKLFAVDCYHLSPDGQQYAAKNLLAILEKTH